MKRQALCLTVLLTILLGATLSSPALAAGPRLITGGVGYTMMLLDGVIAPCWATFAVRVEANGTARGTYRWWAKHPTEGIATLRGEVYCATFSATGSEAVFAVRITRMENWPDLGCDVNYAKVWVRDGGTPGRKGDQVGFYPGDCGPGWTFDPGCAASGFLLSLPVEAGNLTIH